MPASVKELGTNFRIDEDLIITGEPVAFEINFSVDELNRQLEILAESVISSRCSSYDVNSIYKRIRGVPTNGKRKKYK